MKAQTMPRAKDDTDRELQNYLRMMQMEDQALAMAIEKERERIDSQLEKIHRQSNFRIDEMHIKEANFAEAQVLRDMQETEQKLIEQRQREEADLVKDDERHKRMLDKLLSDLRNLKLGIRQRQTAHERVQAVKKRLAERRSTMQLRIEHTELRQQRERRALQDSHARIIKNMSIYRNLILKDYEDKQLQELIASDTDDAERRRQLEEDRADADRLHEAKMLQLKLRMQKEVEQLREEQLLRLNHLTKMSDLELAQVEAWENMLSEQKMQELELEAEQRREVELVEETMEEQVDQLKAFHSQRVMQIKAARTVALQRHEARQLVRQHKLAAKERERMFFANEEAIKEGKLALQEGDEVASGAGDSDMRSAGGHRSTAARSDFSGGVSDISELSETSADLNAAKDDEEEQTQLEQSAELDTLRAKNRQQLDELLKKHLAALELLRSQQREIREMMKADHAQEVSNLHQEQEEEYKQLKIQHHTETEQLIRAQSAADKLEADNKLSNELLYGMLPRYVADAMKFGIEPKPKDFSCVTVLYSDIVSFTDLTAKSNSHQIVNLLNRLYTAFDSTLDDYSDVYKTETIGDAYQVVGGLNSEDNDHQKYAAEVLDCALRFMDAVKSLDMSDQVQKALQIRIGIHSGPAVGGVAGLMMPKFALFGPTLTTAGLMEQKSKPNFINVSEATYELVKDVYDFASREDPITLEDGTKMKSYWLLGKKKV